MGTNKRQKNKHKIECKKKYCLTECYSKDDKGKHTKSTLKTTVRLSKKKKFNVKSEHLEDAVTNAEKNWFQGRENANLDVGAIFTEDNLKKSTKTVTQTGALFRHGVTKVVKSQKEDTLPESLAVKSGSSSKSSSKGSSKSSSSKASSSKASSSKASSSKGKSKASYSGYSRKQSLGRFS